MARLLKCRYPKTRVVTGPGGKRQRVPVTRRGKRVYGEASKWYGEFTDLLGRERRIALCRDKQASRRALDALTDALAKAAAHAPVNAENLPPMIRGAFYKALRASGDPAAIAEHAQRPLIGQLDDWKRSLLDRGATQAYAELSYNRVRTMLEGMEAAYWGDLTADKVMAFLAVCRAKGTQRLRTRGLSVESANHYIRRIKQFARWMVISGRANRSPLESLRLMNANTDRRHGRRALVDEELHRLLQVASSGPSWQDMDGSARALLYRLAVETGLRASELRSLTWGCLDLDADQPTVIVKAAYSKHRRDDTLPLKPTTARILARLRKDREGEEPDTQIFQKMPDRLADMLRADLEAAREKWISEATIDDQKLKRGKSDFLSYADHNGNVADFHSLRHTFITNLARAGVHPKVAQSLARHSSITLTMDHYTHTVLEEQAQALAGLPELPEVSLEAQRLLPGCDTPADSPGNSPEDSPETGSPDRTRLASDGTGRKREKKSPSRASASRAGRCGRRRHQKASPDTPPNRLRALGLEPRTYGLKGRCSAN
jgi:integrase